MDKRQEQAVLYMTLAVALSTIIDATLSFMEHELKLLEIPLYIGLGFFLIIILILAYKSFNLIFKKESSFPSSASNAAVTGNMLFNLSENTWRNYTISFFAGLAASLTVVFASNQENSLIKIKLLLAIVVLYFVGAITISLSEKK